MNASELSTFESLSEALYASSNAYDREQAGRALQMFVQPPAKLDFSLLTRAQFVLDQSSSSYALVLAATALSKVIRDHWAALTPQTRVGFRMFLSFSRTNLSCSMIASNLLHDSLKTARSVTNLSHFFVCGWPRCAGHYLLNLVGSKGTRVEDFVGLALIKLMCLVLKLSWMDNIEQTEEIMQQLGNILQVRLLWLFYRSERSGLSHPLAFTSR